MEISEFKKVGRLLKLVYKQFEAEALENGLDILSPQYEELLALIREATLKRMGYTLEEYREAKNLYLSAKADIPKEEFEKRIGMLEKPYIPSADEIITLAHKVAKQYVKPPQITNQIVKETTKIVEKPQIIETKVIEKVVEYKEPPKQEPIDVEALEAHLREVLKPKEYDIMENIKILNMPDFRKLAMGLQEQIDSLRSDTTGTSSILTATGDINDTNLTFTFTERPALVVVNGAFYQEAGGAITWTWSGSTATLSSPVGTGGSIFGMR